MKRPRRPTKKTVRKAVRKKTVKRSTRAPAPAEPFKWTSEHTGLLKIGNSEDRFYVFPNTIPDQAALMWLPINVDDLDRAQHSGWWPIPGHNGLDGMMLVWAPVEVARDQRLDLEKKAKDQLRRINELFGLDQDQRRRREGRTFPLVSPDFMVSSSYESVPSDTGPLDVEVTIKFRLSGRLQDMAAALHLTPEIYAQRRLELYIRGEIGGLLLPSLFVTGGPADSLELHETGNFQLTSRI